MLVRFVKSTDSDQPAKVTMKAKLRLNGFADVISITEETKEEYSDKYFN